MKKLILLFFTIVMISCSSNDVEPIVLTEESFSVEVNSTGFFGTNNIQATINEDFTFLIIEARLRDTAYFLEIGSEEEGASILTEGVYSVNSSGNLVANIRYENGTETSSTEVGFFRRIEIESIDLDSGIIFGNFSGILPSEESSIHLTNGKFIGVFFSVE